MTDHTENGYEKYARIYIDLSDQLQALRIHLEETGAHSTAEEVIDQILLDQFYDMLDAHYDPEQVSQDWRIASIGRKYGSVSRLIKEKMVAGLNEYCNKIRELNEFENISYGGTWMDGIIIVIGGSRNGYGE